MSVSPSHAREHKARDTLGRRRRDTAISNSEPIYVTPRDLAWFEALHRHGALPLPYLHAFTSGAGANYRASSRRAAKLFHEGYLSRPSQQFATLDARCQTLVYDLSERSRRELRLAGLLRSYAPGPSPSHWRHDFMVSCVTASIHIATRGAGCRYIHQDEILERAETELSFDVSYDPSTGKALLRPDGIFGVRYPSGRARLVIVEADCATETLVSRDPRKTVQRNARQYQAFIGGRRYRQALRTEAGLLVFNATTSASRMANMMRVWGSVHGGSCPYALFVCLPQFSRYFKPPEVLTHLFSEPYGRVGNPPFQLNIG